MKKLLAMILTLALLASMAVTSWAGNTVMVRIEGMEGNLANVPVELGGDCSVLWAIQQALDKVGIDYTVAASPYGGSYITQAAGLQEGAFGGYEGWLYYVDGVSPAVSMSLSQLQGGEEVVLIYTNFDVLVPIVEAYRDHKGSVHVTVTADVTTYDESNNWAAVVTRQPVADVKVTVEGEAYLTDETGAIVLSADASAKEQVSIQLEKTDEAGLPQVVRLAPDATLSLAGLEKQMPYPDLAADEWYTEPVLKLSDLGVVNGFPDGTFRPGETVTRAQVATMLWRLQEQPVVNYLLPFSDVDQEEWYAEAVRWCAAMGITNGSDGKFLPDEAVTRQDLAVMLVRYQQNVVKTELPQTAQAPAFSDNAEIAPYAAEAVYLLQKAGIVEGTDGKFNPTAAASRGELCKMLSALVVSD